jgi:hypothetical protein
VRAIFNANAIMRALRGGKKPRDFPTTDVAGAFSPRGAASNYVKSGSSGVAGRFAYGQVTVSVAKSTLVAPRFLARGRDTFTKFGATALAGREAFLASVATLKRITAPAAAGRYRARGASTAAPVSADPVWSTVPTISFTLGASSNISIAGYVTDSDPLTITKNAQALPTGVTYNQALQRFEYDSLVGTVAAGTDGHVLTADDAAGDIVSFTLTSTSTDSAAPFMLGHGFAKGDVPSGQFLETNEANSRVVIKRTWNDGSVKHAIIVGRTSLTANVPKTITVRSISSAPGGTNLTHANIVSAAPTASVACGAIGTVDLATLLLSAPFRTWISTPEMVECHYRSMVGADATLNVWFHVRLWLGGRMWVRAIVENGYLNGGAPAPTKTYVPTVIIGGATVYNNGGASLSHYSNCRWTADGWIGTAANVTPSHDTTYLINTKLVPNYWKRNPSSASLDALTQTYTPMSIVNHEAAMGAPGYQPPIGILPKWDALYCTTGDARALRCSLANSSGFNTFGIVWRDPTTHDVPRPADHTSVVIDGGTYVVTRGPNSWELNHAPSTGYLPYIVTGDYWHYETMAMQSALIHRTKASGGINSILRGETRGTGWNMRTVGQYCAISPVGEAVADNYRVLLANNYANWVAQINLPGQNQLGLIDEYSILAGGELSVWMADFWVMSNGHLKDIEPLADMTNINATADWMYRVPVGRLGPVGASNYCYNVAGRYRHVVANLPEQTGPDETLFFDTWGEVFTATFGAPNTVCPVPGALADYDPVTNPGAADLDTANQGYWAVLLCAISYAVDHGATGASAAFARLSGATNFSQIENCGFDDTPIWGIVPRGWGGT